MITNQLLNQSAHLRNPKQAGWVAPSLLWAVAEPSRTLSPGLRGRASPHGAALRRAGDGTAAPMGEEVGVSVVRS